MCRPLYGTCLRGASEGAFPLEQELLRLLGRDLLAVEHLVEGGLVLCVGRRRWSSRPGAQFNRNIFGLSFDLKNGLRFKSDADCPIFNFLLV